MKQWDRFRVVPWGDLAHSTHLRGAGTYDENRRGARSGHRHPGHRHPGGAWSAPSTWTTWTRQRSTRGLGGRPGHAGRAAGRGGPVPTALTDPGPSQRPARDAPDHPSSMRRIRMLRPHDTATRERKRLDGLWRFALDPDGAGRPADGSPNRSPTPGRWPYRQASTTSSPTRPYGTTSATSGTRPPFGCRAAGTGGGSCCTSSRRPTGPRSGSATPRSCPTRAATRRSRPTSPTT